MKLSTVRVGQLLLQKLIVFH